MTIPEKFPESPFYFHKMYSLKNHIHYAALKLLHNQFPVRLTIQRACFRYALNIGLNLLCYSKNTMQVMCSIAILHLFLICITNLIFLEVKFKHYSIILLVFMQDFTHECNYVKHEFYC